MSGSTKSYTLPAQIVALITERDQVAATYETVATEHPDGTDAQLRGYRSKISQRVGKLDATITDAILSDGPAESGIDRLTASGFAPWTSPAGNRPKVSEPTISDAELIDAVTQWSAKINGLKGTAFESVAARFDRDHVQPLLKIARKRESLSVDGSTVTLTEPTEPTDN